MENGKQTPLQKEYKFWYSKSKDNKKNMTKEDFESELQMMVGFSTVEEYWGVYLHMRKPSELEVGSKLFLFQGDIRPLWEDERNKQGGRFYIRVRKEKADRIYEDLVLDYIGEQFDHNEDICGLQIASRPDDVVVISLWTQYIKNHVKEDLCSWMRKCLEIPANIKIDYQDHPRAQYGDKKYANPGKTWYEREPYRKNSYR
jgi:translation initiation factor 4E